jgi:hypothetical protein
MHPIYRRAFTSEELTAALLAIIMLMKVQREMGRMGADRGRRNWQITK